MMSGNPSAGSSPEEGATQRRNRELRRTSTLANMRTADATVDDSDFGVLTTAELLALGESTSTVSTFDEATNSQSEASLNRQTLPFDGKVILVTGGANGIGFAISKYLAHRGANVEILDKDGTRILEATTKIRESAPPGQQATVWGFKGSVTNKRHVETCIKYIKEKHKRLDGLVNNAGIVKVQSIAELSDDEWDDIMEVNLYGVMNCTRAVAHELERNGSIVNISSVAGNHGFYGFGAYSAAKHGVIGLSKCAAKEFCVNDIRVNVVCPGFVNTRMIGDIRDDFNSMAAGGGDSWVENKEKATLCRKFADPDEIAPLVAFLLGDESKYITGSAFYCDGGWKEN